MHNLIQILEEVNDLKIRKDGHEYNITYSVFTSEGDITRYMRTGNNLPELFKLIRLDLNV